MNKRKIVNDPVHGFIQIGSELIYDIIQHPYFQRLRRIRQLGLSEYVYPGAVHTRFHHALGAMHLMGAALNSLRNKGVEISPQEYEAAQIAILLHDIGHGPMSHALEYTILQNVPHEEISRLFMLQINQDFNNALAIAIQIFTDTYPRRFLHQLVSSQLDVDRLDYLQRDSFFTGVQEGTIGSERIIKMLNLANDELVVEEKGIYSIESFLTARRLMYWQVYLHKTNICAEQMLIQAILRAKDLIHQGKEVFASPNLLTFLRKNIALSDFQAQTEYLQNFAQLDDYDIWFSLKYWAQDSDKVLATLSQGLLTRKLFKITLSTEPSDVKDLQNLRQSISQKLQIKEDLTPYLLVEGEASNEAYLAKGEQINILTKKGEVLDIAQASDLPNIKALRKLVKKYYVCWLRD
ncbi:MAG: HD domain-containing protein [Microscillaceae bacterium]|nr:HD domain-containing protein [Microscillaceae bacterium]